MVGGNKFPWLGDARDRVLSIGLSESALSAFCAQVRRLVGTHKEWAKASSRHGTSPIVAMLSDPTSRTVAGVRYWCTKEQNVDTIRANELVANMSSWCCSDDAARNNRNAKRLLTRMLDDGWESLSGIPRMELRRGPNQLLRDVFDVPSDTNQPVRIRKVMILPSRTIGTCTCCMTDQRTRMLCSMAPHRPLPTSGKAVRDAQSRSIWDFVQLARKDVAAKDQKEFDRYSSMLVAVLNALNEVETPDEQDGERDNLSPVNLLPTLFPEDDRILTAIACFRIGKKGIPSFSIRLACTECIGRFNDHQAIRRSVDNAKFIEQMMRPNPGNGAHEAARAIEKGAKGFRRALRQLEKESENSKDSGLKLFDTTPKEAMGHQAKKADIHQLCVELLEAQLVDLVANPKDAKSKTGVLRLAKGVKVNDARQALTAVTTMTDDFTVEGFMEMSAPAVESAGDPAWTPIVEMADKLKAPKRNASKAEWQEWVQNTHALAYGVTDLKCEDLTRAQLIELAEKEGWLNE